MTTAVKSCHTRADTKKVLAYVNRIRTERMKLKPLKFLKRGRREDAQKCSIAASLTTGQFAADIDGEMFEITCITDASKSFIVKELPKYVAEWITKFDEGAFPELTID